MPKARGSKKKIAAKNREARKRGDSPVPRTDIRPIEAILDPTYVDASGSEHDDITLVNEKTSKKSDLANERKRRHENADLMPEKAAKQARTTEWRNKVGKTKKARATMMQPSIVSLFKPKPSASKQFLINSLREEDEEIDTKMVCENVPASLPLILEEHTLENTTPVEVETLAAVGEVVDITMFDGPNVIQGSTTIIEKLLPTQPTCETSSGLQSTNHETPPPILPMHETSPEMPSTPCGISPDPPSAPRQPHEDEILNDDISAESPESPQARHSYFRKLIKTQRKKLNSKKSLNSNAKVASILIDLEALYQFNDLRLQYEQERLRLIKKLETTPHRLHPRLKARISKIKPSENASIAVAARCTRGPTYARTIRSTAAFLLRTGLLPESKQGKGAYHESLLNRPEVSSALQKWVKGVLPFEEGGFVGRMRPAKLRRYVNDFLLPQLKIQDTISESTAHRWLKRLGFSLHRVQKGVYVDGHEREDVVAARNELMNYMYTMILPYCITYEGADLTEVMPLLKEGEKIHYPVFHDETCVHANDQDNFVWMREGEQPLRNKSRGRIVHCSDFIIEQCGRLCLNEEEIKAQMKLPAQPHPPNAEEPDTQLKEAATSQGNKGKSKAKKAKNSKKCSQEGRKYTDHQNEWVPPPPPAPFSSYRLSSFDARRIIYPGANYDPWWDMPQLISQDAIKIFETKYPNGIAVFIFDCSSAHEAFAADALLAHKMNRGPGGKQPVMRQTINPLDGTPQSMVFPEDYNGVGKDGVSLAGRPKGMEQVLRERGLLTQLEARHGANKVIGVCGKCKLSQAARDAAMKEAKAKQDEIEGSGIEGLNSRGVSDLEAEDLERPRDCCMQRVLSLQKDFREEKPLLQLVIENAGHKCLFLPKFHCELNPIEMVWGQAKRRFREFADGTFPTAKKLIPECLDHVTTTNIRHYFRHCWRYMDAYKRGLNIRQAAYAVKKYTSHRRIPASVMMDVNIIQRGTNG